MRELLYHLVTNAVEIYLILRFFLVLFGEFRIPVKNVVTISLVVLVAYTGINTLRTPMANLAIYFTVKLGIAFLFEGSWKKKILAVIAITAVLVAIDLILFQIFTILSHDMQANFYTHGLIALMVRTMVIHWLVLKQRVAQWQLHKNSLIIVAVIWALIFVYAVLFTPEITSEPKGSVRWFFLEALFLVLAMLVFFIFEIVARQHRAERLAGEVSLQLKAQEEYYMQFEHYESEIRRHNHDMKNFLFGLVYSTADERMTKIKEKIQDVEDAAGILYSKNETVQLLLHTKLQLVEIPTEQKSVFCNLPRGLKMDKTDLAILLGNLLDNCVQAMSRLPVHERRLDLSFRYDPQCTVFEFTNTYNIQSCEEKSRNRGFGLTSVRQIIEKYDGEYQTQSEDNRYSVKVRIPLV